MITPPVPILEVDGLSVDYDGNQALHLPSLQLMAGMLTGIVGANGAGKSTLVNALLNWSRGAPHIRGRVRLAGRDISRLSSEQRTRLGMLLVPEGHGIFHRMTVAENLNAVLAPTRTEGRHLFTRDEVLSLFPRLTERLDHLGSALSGGERQMLAVSRALLAGPKVLLLDEPSIGLAPQLVLSLLKTVRSLVDRGLTVLLVEQNVRAAIDVVDRLCLLERGRLVSEGDVGTMRNDPRVIDAYLGTMAS